MKKRRIFAFGAIFLALMMTACQSGGFNNNPSSAMEEYAENYVNMPFFNDACDNVVYAMNGLWDTMGEACQEVQQVHSQGNDRSGDTPRGLYESVPF